MDGDELQLQQRLLIQHLESLQQAGVTHLPLHVADQVAALAATKSAATSQSVVVVARTPTQPPGAVAPSPPRSRPAPAAVAPSFFNAAASSWPPLVAAEERPAQLKSIAAEVARCTLCAELAQCRTQTVFGVGSPQPRLCFLGEAPGADEDIQGEPFVGRAGQLLNKIIEACTMQRSDVYILNILKCRPPGNRTPAPEEAANCFPFLERQLAVLRPEFICCLGAVAAQNLLQSTQSIGKLRGRFHDFRGIKVLCTYHPAYLLRYPAAKRDTWEDMKLLMAEMGIALPSQSAQ